MGVTGTAACFATFGVSLVAALSDASDSCGTDQILLQRSGSLSRLSLTTDSQDQAGAASSLANSCDVSSWPDKDHGLVCGDCKVLVDQFKLRYHTCDHYCSALGRQCVGAWEEHRDTCAVKYRMACDQEIASSDAICQCSSDVSHPSPTLPPGGRDGNQACSSQWENQACEGQFGRRECKTCGTRIERLIGKGLSESEAKQQTADKFFGECGKCSPTQYNIETSGYNMVWNDEFDGQGHPEAAKWSRVHDGSGFGNHELQYYTNRDDNSWVSDGTLKIRARLENYGNRRFTSAKLTARESWLYGKFSVRARVTTGRGTWAAIWAMPRENSYGGWPRSGEIDMMEHVGYDTGKVHGTIHTKAYHHSIGTQIGGSTRMDVTQFHEYVVEWRPDIVLFACDNEVYQIFKRQSTGGSDTWPFDQKFYLILNLAVGGDWGGIKGIDEDAFRGRGQILEVDYARVEQRS